MVRSLFVVGLVVAATLLVTFRVTPQDPVQTIELGPEVTAARIAATFPISAPRGLGEQWRPTSARIEPVPGEPDASSWHMGYVTPADEYAALEQSDGPAEPFVARFAAGATPAGEVQIGGRTWLRLDGGSGESGADGRALLATEGQVTTLVTGTADYSELAELAGALRRA